VKRTARLTLAVVALVGGSGCLPVRPSAAEAPAPTATSEWPAVYALAITESRESRNGVADRVLSEFAEHFPGSPEATEVPYWRAVLKLDPNNASASREALTLLESYLANTPSGLHRTEAMTLRRLATALVDARAAALAAQAAPPVHPEDKAHEDEMRRLNDELAKANAELARIKRRLARPKP
jgi:hypothetical protein